ncbi:hypothetical protein Bpfe_028335, partial [Biomphalaria pfeifferi]
KVQATSVLGTYVQGTSVSIMPSYRTDQLEHPVMPLLRWTDRRFRPSSFETVAVS